MKEVYSSDNNKVKVFYNQFSMSNKYTIKRNSKYGWEYVISFDSLYKAVEYAKKIFVA